MTASRGQVPFDGPPTRYPYTLVVPQNLLADVLAGGGEERLDAYEASRRPVAAAVVTMTDRLTRAAIARNPLARTARNTVLRLAGRLAPVRRALAMNLSELSTDPGRTATRDRGERSLTAGAPRTDAA